MIKKIIVFIIILFPLNVFASNNITISCNDEILKNNQETECIILASDLNFIITSISGKVITSDNLLITESLYDELKWKILDKKFNVKDINLISEEKEEQKELIIASFKIKAINKKASVGTIAFEDVFLGDENYEEHEITIDSISVDLKYEKLEKFELDKNIDSIIPLFIIGILIMCYYIYLLKNK